MAIEKGLYSAPKGVDEEVGEGELEIEIVNPEDAMTGEFDDNLADMLEDSDLNSLAKDICDMVESDIDSRKEWADTFVKGLDVLGFKYEERTEPWEGACGVYSTVLAEAAIRFQAETMSETFPSSGPVKTKILGEETKENVSKQT